MFYVLKKENDQLLVVSRHWSMLKALEAKNAFERKTRKGTGRACSAMVWPSRQKLEPGQEVLL